MTDYVVKVRERGLITLPKEIMEKYGLREGSELLLRDEGHYITLEPRYSIENLFSVDADHREELLRAIRELERERREGH